MSKKPCFRGLLNKEDGKFVETTSNLNDSTFTKFINTVKLVALEKVSFSETQNPQTVC